MEIAKSLANLCMVGLCLQNTRLLNFACCAFLIEPASTETYAFAPKASWKLTFLRENVRCGDRQVNHRNQTCCYGRPHIYTMLCASAETFNNGYLSDPVQIVLFSWMRYKNVRKRSKGDKIFFKTKKEVRPLRRRIKGNLCNLLWCSKRISFQSKINIMYF